MRETDARGNTTTYEVDPVTSRNREVTDRCGNKTAYEYDADGRTTKVTSKKADGTELANVSYAYDTFDNLTAITRGDGLKYALTYNAFRNLESIGITGKTDGALVRYTYKNGSGRLKAITYANGDTMKATYNTAGQMIAEKWYNASNTLTAHYKYVYDGDGNIVRSLDMTAKKEYTYEYREGNLIRAAEYTITVDAETEIITAKTLVNTVLYVYDAEGKLVKKTLVADGTEQITYFEHHEDRTVVKFAVGEKTVTAHAKNDTFGRKEFDELQLGAKSLSRRFAYHEGEATTEHVAREMVKSEATTQLVKTITFSGPDKHTLSYEYDAEERITSVVESYTVDGVTTTNTTLYTYDALGQLLTETVNGTVVNTMTYDNYDNYGNIVSKNGVAYGYDTTWKDKLVSYGGQTISYDAQGNPTSYLGHTLLWEKGRQLKTFIRRENNAVQDVINYTYNAKGIRTSKTIDGVRHDYILDGVKILKESWNGNTLIPLYDEQNAVCGIVYNGTPYYFLKNLQNDIIAIADANGTTVARYTYDAWGVPTITQDTTAVGIATINPFRYRGYYYDTEIGMYYLQSRYYDPTVGRFVNGDMIEITVMCAHSLKGNAYCYCENTPINKDDPSGFDGGISAVLAVLASVFKYVVLAVVCIALIAAINSLSKDPAFQRSWASFCASVGTTATKVGEAIWSWGKQRLQSAIIMILVHFAVTVGAVTKILRDVKAKVQKGRVYRLAYVSNFGVLCRIGKKMNFVEALGALGISGATNSISQRFYYSKDKGSSAENELKNKGGKNARGEFMQIVNMPQKL